MQEVGNCVIFCAKQAALGQPAVHSAGRRARAGRYMHVRLRSKDKGCVAVSGTYPMHFLRYVPAFFIVEAMTFRTCRTGHSIILVHSAVALFYITC